MKHHCHCGFREHFGLFRARKLGLVGGIFLMLHLLFHVVECLILPSILVGLGGHLAEEPASATNGETIIIKEPPVIDAVPRYDFTARTSIPVYDVDFYHIRL